MMVCCSIYKYHCAYCFLLLSLWHLVTPISAKWCPIGQESLRNLALLSIEHDEFEHINVDDVPDRFLPASLIICRDFTNDEMSCSSLGIFYSGFANSQCLLVVAVQLKCIGIVFKCSFRAFLFGFRTSFRCIFICLCIFESVMKLLAFLFVFPFISRQ